MSELQQARSSVRGLATLAMLKTNFDLGRDHLAMFEPFVLDTIANMAFDGVTDAAIQSKVASRHQLSLPLPTIRTLLHRATKAGLVRRDGGRYFRGVKYLPGSTDLLKLRSQTEARQAQLVEEYHSWAAERGIGIDSQEIALQSLIGFIERHHVRLALDGFSTPLGVDTGIPESADENFDRAAAEFLQLVVAGASTSAEVLAELLEGYVLQNTLLLADVSTATRRFSGLRVFFDSNLLFGALGLEGEGNALLSADLIRLLREQGARPEVFRVTIREMQRVLAVYEAKLGTGKGRRELYPTDLTRHFLTSRATPADIRTISSTLERSVESLGLTITEAPQHVPAFTLDESILGNKLSARPGGENVPRVVHDVDCVAAVLTLRRGASFESFDGAQAVFVTSSRMTVLNSVAWYEEQGGSGVPPITHLLTLSNLAWLKRPAGAGAMKLNELVVLCAAALRPPRRVWNLFLGHLDRMEQSGQVSSDEVAAIMASGLTDRLLADDDLGDDPDAGTLTEVVERVKASLIDSASERIAEAEAAFESLSSKMDGHLYRVEHRSQQVGSALSWVLTGLAAASLALGTVSSLISAASGLPPHPLALVLGGLPLALGGVMSLLWGFNVLSWRRHLETSIASRLRGWLGS